MNREMRRLSEREERRNKKGQGNGRGSGGKGPGAPGGKGGSGSKGSSPAKGGDRPGLWARLTQFLREVRVELARVNWPTRQQMIAFTSVTVITTVALTLVVFAMDFAFRRTILAAIRAILENQ